MSFPVLPDTSAVSLSDLQAERTIEALAYWETKRGGRALPLIADFNPAEIPYLLPYIVVLDVIGHARNYVFRIVGERNRDILGVSLAGKTLEVLAEYDPGIYVASKCLMDTICRDATPRAVEGSLWWARRPINHEAVFLPFSRNGDQVDRIIEVVAWGTWLTGTASA